MQQRRAIRTGWKMGLLIIGVGLLPARVLAAPIFGASPRTQFFLGTAVRSFGQFQRLEGGGKELKVWTAPAIFSYALATNATLNLTVPYVNKHLETPTGTFDASGIGDITLFGKYTFYRRDLPFGRDQLAVIGGLELPSGSTSKGPGLTAAPALQLGSGGVDGIVGIAAGTTRSWYSIEAALRGKINSEAKDFQFGNVLLYDLYLAYQTYPEWPTPPAQLNLGIEFNGRTSGDNAIDGKDINTGGTVLFISPGIQYIVTGNLLFETGVQIPIVNDFPSGRLEPDYTVLFGFRYLF
ncbi:MAG: transporter [Candidatus Methylomirabilales bacterium]